MWLRSWPYPRWIGHRGAGKLAPENTLAAFQLGASYGYRMFECDVKLSRDGVPFLLHDDTLQRTTNAREIIGEGNSAIAGNYPWSTLTQLDAGSWHSEAYQGEPLPSFDTIANYCLANDYFLNIEIKPTTSLQEQTGAVVAHRAAQLWQGTAVAPLLSSFSVLSLEAAQAAQADLPRGLLLDNLWTGWLETALRLDCRAVICEQSLWDASSMTQAKSAGFKTLSYTVNDEWAAQRLLNLGIDGIITDRVDYFSAKRAA